MSVRSFIYLHCDEIKPARDFYTGVLGLSETFFSDEMASVGYQVGDLQLSVTLHRAAGRANGWASQLGWEGGTTAAASWGFELSPEDFRRAVENVGRRGVEAHNQQPAWVGYWSFPVRDPMGNTVELSTPGEEAWSTE